MGKTFAEKVMAKAAGLPEASVGQVINVYPSLIMSHAASWRCIKTLEKLKDAKLYDTNRIAMVMDHNSPARTAKTAGDHKICREFAREKGIKKFYDVNAGIAHVVLMENGHVHPGMVLIGTDSHSTIYGAFGAAGTGVGFSEVTAAWISGYLWMKVPETIKVVIEGPLKHGTTAKDIMLYLIGQLTADGATYKAIEFHGSYVKGLSIAERITLCNLSMEMGTKFAYVPPDEVTRTYLSERGVKPTDYEEIFPDADATYVQTVTIDASKLEPQIACPHVVDNVKPLAAVAGKKIDQVFIGSCANANYDDLALAASILKGHKLAPGVRMLVTPASKNVLERIIKDGIYTTFVESGALLMNPGCGACSGDGGVMADGEVTLSTANRNFQGRMGSYKSEIYLGSPAVAAASAITGVITDPQQYMKKGE